MVKPSRIAYGVRVKLNSNFQEKCLGDKYLKEERILFISCEKPMNDTIGEYVRITGGSLVNSGEAYLNEIDLEFEVPETPLYSWEEKKVSDEEAAEKISGHEHSGARYDAFIQGCKFKEEQIRGKQK